MARLLRSKDDQITRIILEALTAIGDPAALPELLELLEDDEVSEQVAEAIGACQHVVALPALVARLNSEAGHWTSLVAAIERILSRYDTLLWGAGHWEVDVIERLDEGACKHLLVGDLADLTLEGARGSCRLLARAVEIRNWTEEKAEVALWRVLALAGRTGIHPPPFPLQNVPASRLESLADDGTPEQKSVLAAMLGEWTVPQGTKPSPYALRNVEGQRPLWMANFLPKSPSAPPNATREGQRAWATQRLLLLMGDSEATVRLAAARSLGTANGEVTLSDLMAFAVSSEPEIVQAVYEASDRMLPADETQWQGLLTNSDPRIRIFAARAARRATNLPRNVLLGLLESETEPAVRDALIDNAMHRRERIYPWLRSHWESLSSIQTALVIRNLRLNSRGAGFWLERGLDSSDRQTRLEAASIIRERPHLAISLDETRREEMAKDSLPEVRAAAAMLFRPDEDNFEEVLASALRDPAPEVASAAFARIAWLQSETARLELKAHFERSDSQQRRAILETLAATSPRDPLVPGRGRIYRWTGRGENAGAGYSLAASLLDNMEHADSAARVLWRAPLVIGGKNELCKGAIQNLRPDWVRPAPCADPPDVGWRTDCYPGPTLPHTPVGQASWMEAAMYLRNKYLIGEPVTLSPWAERVRLLALLEVGSNLLNGTLQTYTNVFSSPYPEDKGLNQLAARIRRESRMAWDVSN